ncbi:hypothetical protein TTHERM_00292190 (macronuclear) [Tetrahymena thermophila SB210]|uniref:Transmembrane protein n=1 Tax=Tetrahymena thermophila (strain SB210) TaxID=312017 RepID=I7M8N1_TETTS|nr:hypothetical protein TTHERM_00292190 [Tetrahymena thermophila SB210]EAR98491.1 hypothetical protein TTHERM_00292190 [Tetrahymena thermophila SB210]|eukprot:XP_001018736.1 hypothetical protein TTHERM_00292190 [Tetrahymena thermophila SB210]
MNMKIFFLLILLAQQIDQIKCHYKHKQEDKKNKRFKSYDVNSSHFNSTDQHQQYFEDNKNKDDGEQNFTIINQENYTNITQKNNIDKLFKRNKFLFKGYHADENLDEDELNQKECHNSCEQCNQKQCLACKDQNQQVNFYSRACQCKEGYYMSQLHPLVCKPITQDKTSNRCDTEIQLTAKYFEIKIFSYFQKENQVDVNQQQQDFIIQDIIINTEHSQFNLNNCRDSLQFQYLVRNSSAENQLLIQNQQQDLNNLQNNILLQDIPGLAQGSTRIKIPLQALENISIFQKKNEDLTQRNKILFELNIKNSNKIVRTHRWFLNVYFDGQTVQTFTQDVYQQPFYHCKSLTKCIILQDYDIYGFQYQSDWKTYRETNNYIQGEFIFLRVWFKDSTNTKKLSLQKLYSKTQKGQIFDSTAYVDQNETFWDKDDRSLHIKFQIAQFYSMSIIQISMLIQDINQINDNNQHQQQQQDQKQLKYDQLQQKDKEEEEQQDTEQQINQGKDQQQQTKDQQKQQQQILNKQQNLYSESIIFQFKIKVND